VGDVHSNIWFGGREKLNQGERVTAWKIQGVKVDDSDVRSMLVFQLTIKRVSGKIAISKPTQRDVAMKSLEFLRKQPAAQKMTELSGEK
jgi:hypothetical protein